MKTADKRFDWDYVDARSRRRVRRTGLVALIVLMLASPALLLLLAGDESVQYVYQSFAVAGQVGEDKGETAEEKAGEAPREAVPEPVVPQPVDAGREPDRDDRQPPAPPEPSLPLPDSTEAEIAAIADTRAEQASAEPIPAPVEPQRDPPVVPQDVPPVPPVEKREPRPSEPESPQTAEEPEAPQPLHRGGLAEADTDITDGSAAAVTITAGVNAPYYRLTSLDEYLRMAREHGGRFLAWNGTIAVKIGSSLDGRNAPLEILGPSWHGRYATRMAPLPAHESVDAVRRRVLNQVDLGGKAAIMLSLPYAYDQEILRAQLAWFAARGMKVDVRAVTEGRFESTIGGVPRFRVERVYRDGRLIFRNGTPQAAE